MSSVTKKEVLDPVERLRRQTSAIGEEVTEFGRLTGEVALEQLDRTKEAATELYQKNRTKLTTYVKKQPMRSVGIALAVGAVIGFLLARRK